jgi:hydroxymethylglutaryl-CoA reductase (NADPH)
LTGITTSIGDQCLVRMEFDTSDAMWHEHVTPLRSKAAEVIGAATGARLIALSGNMCTDKKPAAVNVVLGRGRSVAAGIHLPDPLIREVLKTDARTLADVNTRKNLVGSARAGSLGFNAHAANIVAAIFIACGQDPAMGRGSRRPPGPDDDGVYVAVTLPRYWSARRGNGDLHAEGVGLLGAGRRRPAGTHARRLRDQPARCLPGNCP